MGKFDKRLTPKQRIFVAEYVQDFNATRAAIAADYSLNRSDRAGEIGYQLLQKTPIREAVERATELRLKELGVHAEAILRDRVRVASSDARRLFNENGTLKAPKDWDEDIVKAIAGFEVVELFEGKGDDRKLIGYLKRVKLNDRNPAQRDLMEHAGLFPQKQSKTDVDVNVHGDISLTNLELSARAIYLIKCALERKKEAENQAAAKTLPKPQ